MAGVFPALAAPRPDCAGPVEVAGARVVRVERNGVLVLADGRAVVLEGIRLNRAQSGGNAYAAAPETLAALRALIARGPGTFTALRPKEDRYDRIRAQGFVDGIWMQAALLEQGLARAAPSPDRGECAALLADIEARGRARHPGAPGVVSAVRRPQDMAGTIGTFQVVEGWITNVGRSGARVFLDFGEDRQRGFSATIAPEDRARFRGLDLDGLVARHVRIRGMVEDGRGRPQIALSTPDQIEFLDGARRPH